MTFSSSDSLFHSLDCRAISSPIAFACEDSRVIGLSTLHCSVRAVNMKTDGPGPNLTTALPCRVPLAVSKLILADESPFKTISSSNMVANLCGEHL